MPAPSNISDTKSKTTISHCVLFFGIRHSTKRTEPPCQQAKRELERKPHNNANKKGVHFVASSSASSSPRSIFNCANTDFIGRASAADHCVPPPGLTSSVIMAACLLENSISHSRVWSFHEY